MTSRREFVSAVAAFGSVAASTGPRHTALIPRVEARGTIFYGHPDGNTTLVRFTAYEIGAPGGRLRVYDRRRRLLGTAAMLRTGDVLYGELWLPFERDMRLTTRLEAPGLRGAVRNIHRIAAGRRWTLHVATLVDPDATIRELEALPSLTGAVRAALYTHFGARGNPLPPGSLLQLSDHMPFLRLTNRAGELAHRYGVTMSTIAYTDGEQALPPSTPLALASAGVALIATPRADGAPFERWTSTAADQPLVVAIPPGGTPRALGFTASRDEMMSRVDRWLTESPRFLSPDYRLDVALVVHAGAADDLPAIVAATEEWNARFAYPRIVLGQADDVPAAIQTEYGTSIPVAGPPARTRSGTADYDLVSVLHMRESAADQRSRDLVAALAGVWPDGDRGLEAIAARIDTAVTGTIVFNPSPFPRTDMVRLADRSEQIVTDVPELGYAFFPNRPGAPVEWTALTDGHEIEGTDFRVRLDRDTGAIASLMTRPDAIELVRPESGGLNAAPARLESAERLRLPGIANRLVATRRLANGMVIRTTVTAYHHLSWVDITNEGEDETDTVIRYRFAFALDRPAVAWEIPLGYEERATPVPSLNHLRWIRLSADRPGVLFRGLDAPHASVDGDGTLESTALVRRSRYRIAVEPRSAGPLAPWRFGWHTEPLLVAPVAPNPNGTLPRFGSLLSVDRAGVAVLALKPADDGRDLVLVLQELLGAERAVSVRDGVIRFGRARTTDFLERDTNVELARDGSGIRLTLPAWGVAAARLLDVELNRG